MEGGEGRRREEKGGRGRRMGRGEEGIMEEKGEGAEGRRRRV